MNKRVFKEVELDVVALEDEPVLMSGFNGDYSGGVWDEDDYEDI